MPITLAQRTLVIEKMDRMFESDIKMRKDTTAIAQRSSEVYGDLKLLQKVISNKKLN
jgi:uncharacterized protein (UPF0335 family)